MKPSRDSGLCATGVSAAARLSKGPGRPVQIVVMNTAPVDLVHRILRASGLPPVHGEDSRFCIKNRNKSDRILPETLDRRSKAAHDANARTHPRPFLVSCWGPL